MDRHRPLAGRSGEASRPERADPGAVGRRRRGAENLARNRLLAVCREVEDGDLPKMSPNPPPTAELLAAHSVSLRALARHLVGDPHAAEDVVQDTWLRALERPPARMDTLGAWLRSGKTTPGLRPLEEARHGRVSNPLEGEPHRL